MAPSVVLLLPKKSYRADDFFRAAKALSLHVIVASDRCHALAGLWPASGGGLDEFKLTQTLPLPFHERDRAVRELVEQVRAARPAAVIGVDEETAVIAALASEQLGLPHNPIDALEAARNKWRTRRRLRAAGVPGPWHRVIPRDLPGSKLAAVAARMRFPCVLKPLVLSASRGVIRAGDPRSFEAAFRRIAALLRSPQVRAEKRDPHLAFILAEGFLAGPEVALEGVLSDGQLDVLAIFDKPDPLDGPFFEETLYVTPSRWPAEVQRSVVEMTATAAAALGLREGPLHAELRLTAEGPRVVEVAARSIGGLCGRTLRFGAGVSLEELLLQHALGARVQRVREKAAAGVVMLPIPARGVLKSVRGLDEARGLPGVEDVVITAPLDEELVPLPEGASYLGFAFARGDDPASVEAALRQVQRTLSFEIAPALPIAPRAAQP